jgi:hypothetical protein
MKDQGAIGPTLLRFGGVLEAVRTLSLANIAFLFASLAWESLGFILVWGHVTARTFGLTDGTVHLQWMQGRIFPCCKESMVLMKWRHSIN